MKRIKIMLTAIAVLGTVGGALAFKAAHRTGYLFCSTTKGICPTATRYANTGISYITSYCSIAYGTDCIYTLTRVVAIL